MAKYCYAPRVFISSRKPQGVALACASALIVSALGCTPGSSATAPSTASESSGSAGAEGTSSSATTSSSGSTDTGGSDGSTEAPTTTSTATTATESEGGSSTGVETDDPALKEDLDAILKGLGVPALGVARLQGPALTALAVVGERRLGDPTPALIDDPFHIGSCTKTMTATMVARLVEDGAFAWDDTLAEVFPELSEEMHPDYAAVTIEAVLAHRGGLPGKLFDFPELWAMLWEEGDVVEQRQALAQALLSLSPETPPNTQAVYSNAGYMIVASALEQGQGSSWEELVAELIFEPLEMDSCGFGTPASEGEVDAPWGHVVMGDTLTPIPPGPEADNPPAFGPAGRVHCNLEDWSRFISLHLEGANGSEAFLSGDSWSRLQSDHGGGFGLGLVVVDDPTFGTILGIDGSNTTFYATSLVLPDKQLALLAIANAGAPLGQEATTQALTLLLP